MESSRTPQKQKPSESTRISADTVNKENYPLLTRDEVENTPFTITGNDELGYKLQWGRFNLTDPMPTKEAVKEWLPKHQWEITMSMVHIYVENYDKFKQEMAKQQPELFQ